MANEGFDVEEWDADFLDQLVQAEEMALSSQAPLHHRHPTPPPSTHRPPPPLPPEVSYSPPHELSQRTHETNSVPDYFGAFAQRGPHFAKEQGKKRLKKDVNRVSKRLNHLDTECLDPRKGKDKKEEQLREFHSRIETKDAGHLTKNKESDDPVSSPSAPGTSTTCQNATPSNEQLHSWSKSCCRSEKLFALWNSTDQKEGRFLVAKLFKTCESDFDLLFNHLGSSEHDSKIALSNQQCPTQSIEYAKALRLYSVFTKISNNLLRLEDLLEALVDFCNLKNVYIIQWSLRVMYKILSYSVSLGKGFGESWGSSPECSKSDTNGLENLANGSLCFGNVAEMFRQGQVPSLQKLSNNKTPGFSGSLEHNLATSVSGAYQVSLFERMCLIATGNQEEHIRSEALSIMNLILLRHNAYLERDKFAGNLVFWSLSQLLRKEAGFSAQNQAIHVLYLLCNCPKVIAMISSCIKEDGELSCSKDNDNNVPTFQGLNDILIGLADSVACSGSATEEEMRLRRDAIVFLAFLGSSGRAGFEILLNHRLPKGTNFLAIILQSLISDLDLQALKSDKRSGVAGEQRLLIREALILLNRLVSHPHYSIRVCKL